MVLGRSPVLWYALIAAALQVPIVLGLVHLDDVQLGAIDALALALLGVIANERDPLSVGTLALSVHAPAAPAPVSTTAPASLPAAITAPSPAPSGTIVGIDPAYATAVLETIKTILGQTLAPAPAPESVATVPVPVQPNVAPVDQAPPVSVAPVASETVPVAAAPAAIYPPADENHT